MVYHNLSMSLNHHVPIFNCTVTRRGGLSLLFRHLSNCKLTVLSATSPAFLQHAHTHKQTDGRVWLHSCPVSTPSLLWHHLFWVMWPCFILTVGTLVFELHIQCPFVYTTDSLNKGDTQLGGKRRCNRLFSVNIFRPFLTWKKHNPGFHMVVSFPSLSLSLSLFCGKPDATFSSFPSSEINLLSITHECKDYSSCDCKERILYCSINFSQSKRSLYASTATWGNAMYVFGLVNKPNHRVKLSVWRTINMFWMEMN